MLLFARRRGGPVVAEPTRRDTEITPVSQPLLPNLGQAESDGEAEHPMLAD